MKAQLFTLFKTLTSSIRDLLPIIVVIAFFQLLILRQPIPHFGQIVEGLVLVVSS